MRLDGDITTERFLRYIRREPMTEESANEASRRMCIHRNGRHVIRSLRNWDEPFDRCISLASVTNGLT